MSDNVENSHSQAVKKAARTAAKPSAIKAKSAKLRPRKTRKPSLLRRLFYALLILIIVLIIAGWALWVNRNIVMEEAFRRILSNKGFDSALIIDEVTDTHAVIRNIVLSYDGQPVFSADKITALYDWPDVRSGVILSLDVDSPNVTLELGENGHVLGAWMPEPTQDGGSFVFPSGGVRLNDFQAALTTPYGDLDLSGDLDAESLDDAFLNLAIAPTQISLDQTTLSFGGQGARVKLHLKDDSLIFEAGYAELIDVQSAGLTLESLPQETAKLSFDGALLTSDIAREFSYDGQISLGDFNAEQEALRIEKGALNFDGIAVYNTQSKALNLDAKLGASAQAFESRRSNEVGLASAYLKASKADFDYEGVIDFSAQKTLSFKGDLDVTSSNIGLSNAADASALARKIALHETLSKTPIAQQFHAGFTQQLQRALRGTKLDASLGFSRNENGHQISLRKPLVVSAIGSASKITISASQAKPVHKFDAPNGALELAADITMTGDQDLSLSGLNISGRSDMGTRWSQVQRVSAKLHSDAGFRNDAARLGAFDAQLNYIAGAGSDVGLTSSIDYDGPLLGSQFTGLRASGDLSVSSKGDKRVIDFKTDMPVTADKLDTKYGWQARNVTLGLNAGAPLLTTISGDEDAQNISLEISDLSAQILNLKDNQNFDIKAARADIKGVEDIASERWDVKFGGVDLTSETTPGPNSHIKSEQLDIGLKRSMKIDDSPWNYTLSSPAMDANLAQLRLRGLGLELAGSDGDFTVDYSGGTARIEGVELPNLPMTGQAKYEGGALTGTAKTAMPQAPQYPVYATYFYEDGIGGADVDVPEFLFSPNGIQPADLAPVFRGKVAEVSGLASASVKLGYRAGERPTSSGTVTLKDMDIGTLVGPFSGVNTTLNFDSLVPLHSIGTQTITMTGFNAGLPLGAGAISFDVVEGGIAIRSAQWPLASGRIYMAPTTWSTSSNVNRVVIHVENVDLEDMISQLGKESLEMTGLVNGQLPIFVDGVKVLVENGNLSVKNGGVIRVQTEGLDAAGDSNDTAKIAIDALKEFEYKELSLDIDGPLDGDMLVGAVFEGRNKDVLGGADFLFRVNIEGELVNIAKSFSRNIEVDEFLRVIDEELR